jgi:DNA mismatch repair protein MutL
MSAEMFDVNVHPTKMEVRFLDSHRVYSDFLGVIREKFLNTDMRNQFQVESSKHNDSGTMNDPRNALDSSATEEARKRIDDWFGSLGRGSGTAAEPKSSGSRSATSSGFDSYRQPSVGAMSGNDISIDALPELPDRPALPNQNAQTLPPQQTEQQSEQQTEQKTKFSFVTDGDNSSSEHLPGIISDRLAYSPQGKFVVQLHNRYLLLETSDGAALIDQHALHERILYEQIKEKMNEGQLESQRLLVPVPIDLSPNELACVLEHLEFFKTLGLQVEPFGGDTVLISAFPAILSKTQPVEILMSLIEPILQTGKKLNRTEMLEEMLHSMACKAAVKAGDQLRSDAIARLIELAEKEINVHHCPHGRPSILVFTREELDRMFKRN